MLIYRSCPPPRDNLSVCMPSGAIPKISLLGVRKLGYYGNRNRSNL